MCVWAKGFDLGSTDDGLEDCHTEVIDKTARQHCQKRLSVIWIENMVILDGDHIDY
jgi:hypothetical protein